MAIITDYPTLVTAVGDYLARSDSDLSSHIPNFIQNAESRIYKELRIRAMETALSATIASGVIAVPATYIEMKDLWIIDSAVARRLQRTTMEDLFLRYPDRASTGKPAFYARRASNFEFGPFPDTTYSVEGTYYGRLPVLNATTNTDNWFTDNAPDLLLYGALLEAEPYIKNDDRIPIWSQLYERALTAIKREEDAENFSGSTLFAVPG